MCDTTCLRRPESARGRRLLGQDTRWEARGCPGLLDGPSLGQIGAQNEGERGALRHVADAHDVHQSEPGGRSHVATVYACPAGTSTAWSTSPDGPNAQ
jgi:hypothetical protein